MHLELSKKITNELTKNEKKNYGIFFTPSNTVKYNLKILKDYMEKTGLKITEQSCILEPSCGSCEYIEEMKKIFQNANIIGIEKNKMIFERIKHLDVKLINDDFICYNFTQKYDLIIGNPPYFVVNKEEIFSKYYDGRPNIFIFFIIKSLSLLKKNGILNFILPKSFLNCLYYDKTRKYINKNYKIVNIIECNESNCKYIDTKQETIILIIQNTEEMKCNVNNEMYKISIEEYTIFGTKDNIAKLKELYKGTTNLKNLEFTVNVGNIVWNQNKTILTSDENQTLLIYSTDIKDNKLCIQKYKNEEKKNYINKTGNDEPILVINRGYGTGNYNFNYCIINEKTTLKYLIENHLICIKYKEKETKNKLIKKLKSIIKSFNDTRTRTFIEIYFGNNAINTTELYKILPIYNEI